MITPARSSFVRSPLVVAGLVVAATAYLTLPVFAADKEPPMPSVTILDVKKGSDKAAAPTASTNRTSSTSNSRTASSNSRNTGASIYGTKSASKGDAVYVISLRNNSKFAANNLSVEYHFYNKTVTTTNGLSDDPRIEDITSIENVDIEPGKMKDIETKPISHQDVESLSQGQSNTSSGGRAKAMSTPIASSTVTSILGWHIEIKYNDKIVGRPVDHPDNLQKLLDNYHYNK